MSVWAGRTPLVRTGVRIEIFAVLRMISWKQPPPLAQGPSHGAPCSRPLRLTVSSNW